MSVTPTPTQTPNVIIENPGIRRGLGAALYGVSLLAGVATIIVGVFPEVAALPVDVNRVILATNAIVSLLSGAFGIVVTIPNVPSR